MCHSPAWLPPLLARRANTGTEKVWTMAMANSAVATYSRGEAILQTFKTLRKLLECRSSQADRASQSGHHQQHTNPDVGTEKAQASFGIAHVKLSHLPQQMNADDGHHHVIQNPLVQQKAAHQPAGHGGDVKTANPGFACIAETQSRGVQAQLGIVSHVDI